MCRKSILLFFLFVSQVAYSLPKEAIIEKLSFYQSELLKVNGLILSSELRIAGLLTKTEEQQQKLLDSLKLQEALEEQLKNSGTKIESLQLLLQDLELTIQNLKISLENTERDLKLSEENLEKERKLYLQLLKDLESLKRSSNLYRNLVWILGGTTAGLAVALFVRY